MSSRWSLLRNAFTSRRNMPRTANLKRVVALCGMGGAWACGQEARAEPAQVAVLAAEPSPRPRPQPRREASGLHLGVEGGLNVSRPYVGGHLAWRFVSAPYFELLLDYDYATKISQFPFHTASVGMRTYLGKWAAFELFSASLCGVAIAGDGHHALTNRDLGARLLGAFLSQGLGVQASLGGGWLAGIEVATGYPVWLRSQLSVRYRVW